LPHSAETAPSGDGCRRQSSRTNVWADLHLLRLYEALKDKALKFVVMWFAGMFVPLAAKTLMPLPQWAAMIWMIVWALLGYIFAPYGLWKHHRAQTTSRTSTQ
jgi:hypothetical protein